MPARRFDILMCAVLAAMGAWLACFQIVNEDIGWQVATGNRILGEGRIHFDDVFSYTANDQEYQPVHLAWYVTTALVHRALGDEGLILLKMVFGAVFALAVFAGLRRRTPNAVLAFILSLVVLALVRDRWLVRPQLSSYTLFAAVFVCLHARQTLSLRLAVTLIILFAAAANFHPGFIFALGAVGMYALIGPLPLRQGILLAAACSLAGMLTPVSPYHLSFLTEHTYRFDRLGLHEFVTAWPPHEYLPMYALLVVWLAVMGVDRLRGPKWEILTAAVFFGLGIWVIRFIPYAVMASVAMLPGAFERFAAGRRRRRAARAAPAAPAAAPPPSPGGPSAAGGRPAGAILPIAAVAVTAAVALWPYWPVEGGKRETYRPGFGWNTLAMPVRAAEFLDAIGFQGRIANYNTFGGFLILKGYPRWKVEVDGRIQIFDWVYDRSAAQRFAEKPPDAIVWPRYSGEMLPANFLAPSFRAEWALVFMDEGAFVLLRRDGPYGAVARAREAPHVGLPLPHPDGGGYEIPVLEYQGETTEQATARMHAELDRISRVK